VVGAACFSGRRSFTVTSTFSALDGRAIDEPASHAFTMVVDGDKLTAIIGVDGTGTMIDVQPRAGGFRVLNSLGYLFVKTAPCGAFVSYGDLAFTFGPSGELSGTGNGQLTAFVTGVGSSVAVTVSLLGLPDAIAPTLSLAPTGDLTDPFAGFIVESSEPLPGLQVHPILRSQSGGVVTFRPLATPSAAVDMYVTSFAKPEVLLRYGETYRVDLSDTLDFAGNAAVAPTTDGLVFTTRAPPPLVTADGFESVTSDTLGGAQVLSGAGDPIISGSRSLYVPPASAVGPNVSTTQLALRLPIAPGSTTLRFAFRSVNSTFASKPVFLVASVGGSIAALGEMSDSGAATATTLGGARMVLGPVTNALIRLPRDASGEIVFARVVPQFSSCGGPTPPANEGVIIDDLRAE
jgi:hypothetical protein